MSTLLIDGRPLDVSLVAQFGSSTDDVAISDEVRRTVERARAVVDAYIESGESVYGLTTALGSKVTTPVDPVAHVSREHDVVAGRMVGIGDPYPPAVARSAMLIRLHGLGRGAAGVSPSVVDALVDLLNRGIVVRAPRAGTIGASDLGPGAALAGALIGIGSVWMDGDLRDAGAALRASGLVAATFAPKDALGVINSSAFSLAQASHVAVACRGVLAASILAAVANADAFGVNPRVYLPEVHALRPLPHAVQIASMIGHLLEGSWVVDAHTGPQQAISFRTLVPQLASVVGAIERFACAIETEINGVGDNPVVLIDPHVMVSSSHFHTIDLALHGDALSLALYHWTEACVQRVQRTINHRSDELPSLLAHGNAAATGMNPLQKTLGYLRGRMRHLANPASLDGLVVSDQVEDLASQLPLVIDKLDQQVDVLERVLAIEALVAMQCHALRSTHERGHASQVLGAVLEGLAVPFGDGVPLGPELDRMHERLGVVVARALEEVTVCWPTSPLIGSRHSS